MITKQYKIPPRFKDQYKSRRIVCCKIKTRSARLSIKVFNESFTNITNIEIIEIYHLKGLQLLCVLEENTRAVNVAHVCNLSTITKTKCNKWSC